MYVYTMTRNQGINKKYEKNTSECAIFFSNSKMFVSSSSTQQS